MGSALITLDTSAIFALLDRREHDHERVKQGYLEDGGPYLVPAGILGEVGYVVERWLGASALDAVLGDLEDRAFVLECGEEDVPRIRELVARYSDLPLGFADAAVIACTERHGGKVLTLDRDFAVVAREGVISLVPDSV